MKHNEFYEQKALFEWARTRERDYPCLKFFHSSQNGVKISNPLHAVRAKQAGMRSGVPDCFLPFPNEKYHGLFIEMKSRIVKGKPKPKIQDTQKAFILYLNSAGYFACVCYGCEDAIDTIKKYLNNEL